MNLRYLGDALDHWKGSLFESLQNGGVLRDFAVDPMASDLPEWTPEDFLLFSTLLRVNRAQVISHTYTLSNRSKYFAEIRHPGDLFLDPDTGVATGRSRPSAKHISPSEIAALALPIDRLLVIYQHVRGKKACDRVDDVCQALYGVLSEYHWCSYESGAVAMIFVARKSERTRAVVQHFSRLLGRHMSNRIRTSTNVP